MMQIYRIFSDELDYNNRPQNSDIENGIRHELNSFSADTFWYQNGYQKQEELNFVICSYRVLRVSCANHKLNLAIRRGISLSEEIKSILIALNNANASIRRSIKLNSIFRDKRCRL
jgi:hypothetical protein